MTSASQDTWIQIIEGMKDAIRKRAYELLEMDPEAMVDFAEYVQRVMELEIHAQNFDAQLEEVKNNSQ